MATTQTTYTETLAVGRPGQVATASPCIVDSYEVEATAGTGIKFGVAVQKGTNDDQCKVGADGDSSSPFKVTAFLGVTVQDHSRLGGKPVDSYDKGAIAAVLSQGDIWVPAEAAVSVGDDVTVKEATGALSSAAAADGQFSVPGRWMTAAAAAGDLAVVRLYGEIY